MKKILCVVLICMASVVANATDMCARNDTMVFVFDKEVNGTSNGGNAIEWTWWASFEYGRVSGDATCLSATEGLGRTTGLGAYYGTGEYANTFIDVEPGLHGTDSDGNERKYCWCKMTHPFSSRWVFFNAFASASSCVSNCARDCSNFVRFTAMRGGVFGSVGL
jgi:hypothetical protein